VSASDARCSYHAMVTCIDLGLCSCTHSTPVQDWRKKLEGQRGSVLMSEAKNNKNKVRGQARPARQHLC
jgi:hypothetical protein